jgi:hypothetical protein
MRLLIGAAMAVAASGLVHAQAAATETRLKAAVISKLPQFVEWPAGALDGRDTADVCVAPPDVLGPDLGALLAGDSIAGRPLVSRRVAGQDLDGCRLLFVPARNTDSALLAKAAALPILTIGDSASFLNRGGIVQLEMVSGRVRFEINASAAAKVGLRVSSQLMQLALAVRGGQP